MSKHHINYLKFDTSKLSVASTIFFPVLIESALSSFYNVVDMMMVGKYDAAGLSAIGLTSNPLSIFLSIFSAINVGTTTIVAWNIGAQKKKDAQDVIKLSLIMNLVSGIVMTILGILMGKPIVAFMGGDARVQELAIEYYNILVLGTTFQALTYSVTASMRGAGFSKVPMMYNTFSNLLNVVGNYILIYGFKPLGIPDMGVIGAGYSTLISRIICCIWALIYIFFAKNELSLKHKLGKFKFSRRKVNQILRIGIPTAVETLITNCGLMLYVKVINMIPAPAFATHQICSSINGFTAAPTTALSVTTNTVVGQYIGAGEFDNARNFKKYLCKLSIALSAFMSLVLIVFSRPIIGLYAKDSESAIISLATTVFYIIAVQYFTGNYNTIIAGSLRAAGDTQYVLYLTILGLFGVRIPLAYLFGVVFKLGLPGVWLSLLVNSWLNSILMSIRYKSGKWIDIYHKQNPNS